MNLLWGFVMNDPWRAIALVLALALAGGRFAYASMHERNEALTDQVEYVTAQLDVAANAARTARSSALNWETVALDLQLRLADMVKQAQIDRENDVARVAEAQADRQQADAALADWRRRYADSLRTPSCRALMETPLCGTTGENNGN